MGTKRFLDLLHSPRIMSKFHGTATVIWIAVLPAAVLTPLKNSVPFLVAISVWALVGAHWASYQASRSELSSNGDDNDCSCVNCRKDTDDERR